MSSWHTSSCRVPKALSLVLYSVVYTTPLSTLISNSHNSNQEAVVERYNKVKDLGVWFDEKLSSRGYIESAEQSRTAEQNKISKLTVKLQIISTKHDCRM